MKTLYYYCIILYTHYIKEGCALLEKLGFIAKSEKRLKALEALRSALLSKPYMYALLLLACVITVTGTEFCGLLIFVCIITLTLIISDELIATTLPFMLASATMIKCFDSFDTYIKLAPLAPFLVLAIILHFTLYPKPIKAGSTLWSLIAVTVAVTLGGLGSISAKEYFSLTSLYYVVGLGAAMVIVYIIAYSYLESSDRVVIHKTFAFVMYIVCLFSCLMIIMHYAVNIREVASTRSILEPQWRNNVSTFIILTMPFVFYLSLKNYIYVIPAFITMPCLALTSSRGGLLFGAVEFLLCCIYIIYADKKNRFKTLFILTVCGFAMIIYAGDIITFISKTISRFDSDMINKDPRTGFIKRAVEDFKACPVFGRGIGYMGNRDIYPSKKFAANWYQSAPFQVIGSFGSLGIFAFGFQFIRRNMIFWSKITHFSLAVFIAYIGIFLMSLVNPGEFCPVPYELMTVVMFALIERHCPQNKEIILFRKKYAAKAEDNRK